MWHQLTVTKCLILGLLEWSSQCTHLKTETCKNASPEQMRRGGRREENDHFCEARNTARWTCTLTPFKTCNQKEYTFKYFCIQRTHRADNIFGYIFQPNIAWKVSKLIKIDLAEFCVFSSRPFSACQHGCRWDIDRYARFQWHAELSATNPEFVNTQCL